MTGKWIIALCLLLFPFLMTGQMPYRSTKMIEKARQAYARGKVDIALSIAEKVSRNDPSVVDAFLIMAEIYHDRGDLAEEIGHLERAAALTGKMPLIRYRLAEAYYHSGQYDKALESVTSYLEASPSENLMQRAFRLKVASEFAARSVKHPVAFRPVRLDGNINSDQDEYWPSLTIDNQTLVFTRLVPVGGKPGMKQEDFYFSVRDSSGWSESLPLSGLNTPANEGASSVSADGRLLFFTLCNHPGGFGSCDIWFSKRLNGEWSKPINAGPPLNTPGWEGQPSLSAFGDRLYFSSERPGGRGKKDIWEIVLKGWKPDGTPLWGEPTNLGDSINTPGDEISPFIHPGMKDLYFSSDDLPGFGGLDLFHSRMKENGKWSRAENLGWPVNSPGNEQGFVIDRTGTTAFFSTVREKRGNMDIYMFETDASFRPQSVTYVRGKVISAGTGMPVPALVEVAVNDSAGFSGTSFRADEKGVFLVTLPPDRDLWFTVNEKGYLFYTERVRLSSLSSATSPLERLISLIPAEAGNTIDLYNIYFKTNEHAILPESEPELQILLHFLTDHPELSVEIGGHTDNTGNREFNQTLSEKRAASVKQYLVEKGISQNRLTTKGYGFDQPVATNETEEGRARNRRTTMKIMAKDP